MTVKSNFCRTDLRMYITQMYSHIYFLYATHVPSVLVIVHYCC